jgi:hypothetical protein
MVQGLKVLLFATVLACASYKQVASAFPASKTGPNRYL